MEQLLIYVLAFLPHFISMGALFWIIFSYKSKSSLWLLKVFTAILLFSIAFLGGVWGITSIYFKYYYLGLIAIAIFLSYFLQNANSTSQELSQRINPYLAIIYLFVWLLLGSINFLIIKAYDYPDQIAVELEFPLKGGDYYIFQGGNSVITNVFHNTHGSQEFALDIVALNKFGARAGGILPQGLDSYHIFGDTVYSPMTGTVVHAIDGHDDNVPPAMNQTTPLGNQVFIQQGNGVVVLGHFKRGKVFVKEGQTVKTGDPLGLVGNSGRSIEPHLHIQLMSSLDCSNNQPLPMKFKAGFYALNDIIRSYKN